MKDTDKLFSKIEDIIYSIKDKKEDDEIINKYKKLFDIANFNDYKLTFQKETLKLKIKHKAYSKTIYLQYYKNNFYIENNIINVNLINELLPTYFLLDKK